jgi:hypothetical protein
MTAIIRTAKSHGAPSAPEAGSDLRPARAGGGSAIRPARAAGRRGPPRLRTNRQTLAQESSMSRAFTAVCFDLDGVLVRTMPCTPGLGRRPAARTDCALASATSAPGGRIRPRHGARRSSGATAGRRRPGPSGSCWTTKSAASCA